MDWNRTGRDGIGLVWSGRRVLDRTGSIGRGAVSERQGRAGMARMGRLWRGRGDGEDAERQG
jgi:hypothetical protein